MAKDKYMATERSIATSMAVSLKSSNCSTVLCFRFHLDWLRYHRENHRVWCFERFDFCGLKIHSFIVL